MIYILTNWLFILIILFGLGQITFFVIEKWLNLEFKNLHPTIHLLIGMFSLISLCQLFSFFCRIGAEVNLLIALLVITSFVLSVKKTTRCIRIWKIQHSNKHVITSIITICILIIAILKAVSPCEINDERGYHLPLIRWIETFPVIYGIANLEDRMGFNPTKYLADAFFSMRFLFPKGIYELNSFLFIIFNLYFLSKFDRLLNRDYNAIITGILSTFSIIILWRKYLTSVDADYINISLGLLIINILVEQLESNKKSNFERTAFLILIMFSMMITIKFSSIIWIIPLSLIYLNNSFLKKYWLKSTVIFLFIIAPWLGRNYIISGYPIYPIYWIKIGSPNWQVDMNVSKLQYFYVKEFAQTNISKKYLNFPHPVKLKPKDWIPIWTTYLLSSFLGLILLTAIPIATLLLLGLIYYQKIQFKYLIIEVLVLISIIIWFMEFPAIRLAWGLLLTYIVLPFAITFSLIKSRINNWHTYFTIFGIFLTIGYIKNIYKSTAELQSLSCLWVVPKKEEAEIINTKKVKSAYIKIVDDRGCGNTEPPCTQNNTMNITLRGANIRSGFMVKKE